MVTLSRTISARLDGMPGIESKEDRSSLAKIALATLNFEVTLSAVCKISRMSGYYPIPTIALEM